MTMTQSALSSCDIPSSKEASVSRRYDVFSRFIVGMPKTKDTEKYKIKEYLLGHFQVAFCLRVKTSLNANHSYDYRMVHFHETQTQFQKKGFG